MVAPRSGGSDLEFPGASGSVCMLLNTNNYISSNLALFKFFNILN